MALTFRHQEILEVARSTGRVTVDGLAEQFEVTPQTIRRDLGDLCDAGLLTRVHGGAVLASGLENFGYSARQRMARGAKDAIGELCAEAIPSGSSLFLDIGTTTEAVARALLGHRDLLVVTNNLNVARILSANERCDIHIAGGQYRRSDMSVVGDAAAAFIREFKVDVAVIGTSAIEEDGALLDYDRREVTATRAMLANARASYLVADASKFDRRAPARVCSVHDLSAVFTDLPPPPGFQAICAQAGVTVTAAKTRNIASA
ncbi:MAG: DeoR/GlpR family DNA-binding transcription regulator [Pseudomonadota bacterium]